MHQTTGWYRVAAWQKKLASATTILALVVLTGAPLFVPAVANANDDEHEHKVNICHATSSQSHPWNATSVDQSALATHLGHGDFLYAGPIGFHGSLTDSWCGAHVPPATLTVKKHVVNDNNGSLTAANFTLHVSGSTDGASFAGSESGTVVHVPANTNYTVTEDAATGYTSSLSGACSGTLFPAATATCTVTNDDQAATLHVHKVIDNTGGGQGVYADFGFMVNNANQTMFDGDGSVDVSENTGTYTVTESPQPVNYSVSYSGCTDVQLSSGGEATCTITNTYVPPEVPPGPSCDAVAHTVVSDTTTQHNASSTVALAYIHSAWTATIPGATWIWGEEPLVDAQATTTETFTKTFTIAGTPTGTASLDIAADNSYTVDVNGNTAVCADATENNFGSVDTCVIPAGDLVAGTNTLTFTVTNWYQSGGTQQSNPAGLMYKLSYNANECQQTSCVAGVNLVQNPSFEAPVVTDNGGTWQLFGNGTPLLEWLTQYVSGNTPSLLEIQRHYSGWLASQGDQFAELDSNESSSIYQDIPTVPGKTYKVGFDFAARPDASSLADNAMNTFWGGQLVAGTSTDLVAAGPNTLWQHNEYSVVATTTTTRVQFSDTGTSNSLGGFVDNVSVMCQPEQPKSTVTLCKYDTHEHPLAGWTLMLKGGHVEDVVVPANASAGVDTAGSLTAGTSYIATASGTWDNQGGANPVDAEYSTTDSWATHMDGYTGYQSDILELQINQAFDPNSNWGPYNAAHTYAQSFVPSSTGSSNFRIFDGTGTTQNEGWYGDNSGSLNVSIDQGYAGVTGENGCVTFTNVPYGSYTVGEVMQPNWTNQSGLSSLVVDQPTESQTVVNKDNSEVPTTATISSEKVVCDAEQYLPNWGAGGADITADTAQDWVNQSAGHCHLAEWSFQWSHDGVGNPGDNVHDGGAGWDTFSGSTSVPAGARLWVREMASSDYVPFTGQNTDQSVSAEMYCSTDVLNYDNWDWIDPVVAGQTYHCVGFNAPKAHDNGGGDTGATITIIKKTNGGDGTFSFNVTDEQVEGVDTDTSIATNDGTGTKDVEVPTGTYDVTEDVPQGWTLNSVVCDYDGEESGDAIIHGETVFLPDNGDHVTCTFTNTKNPTDDGPHTDSAPTTPPGGGGPLGAFSFGGGGPLGGNGQVLGASCGISLNQHLRFGSFKNNNAQVKILQGLLNKYVGTNLPITGFFGPATEAAVKAFQLKYADEILKPWGLNAPTGLVYLATLWKLDDLECPDATPPFPTSLIPWSANPNAQ